MTETLIQGINYTGDNFILEYYPKFILDNEISELAAKLGQWVSSSNKRSSQLFGDDGIIYTTSYFGHIQHRPVQSWSEFPMLLNIKENLEQLVDQKFNVCIIQNYPNGNIGIAPHKDREMRPGSMIAGISIGAERIIRFSRNGYPDFDLVLENCSLYIMKGETNQAWTHSIIKQPEILDNRFSLTYRNY